MTVVGQKWTSSNIKTTIVKPFQQKDLIVVLLKEQITLIITVGNIGGRVPNSRLYVVLISIVCLVIYLLWLLLRSGNRNVL